MTVTVSSFSALPGIRHAFFTREGGVSSGIYESLNAGIASKDDATHVKENRARMARMLGVAPENFVTAYQIHSPHVAVVDKPWDAASRPKADAVVTRVPGLAIGVSTADCGPVLFA
ncbi:MAG: laccase domain-containing protein, partial [Pseudorhodoplanes sp.]